MTRPAVLLAAMLLSGCAGMLQPATTDNTAAAEVKDATGRTVGTANLTQLGSAVRIVMQVSGLPPGVKGVHIHEVGKCEGPAFTSAGGHFNPDQREHGALNPKGSHAGDLPNLTVGGDGTGRLETTTEQISLGSGPTTLADADGSAIVIHAAPDDFRTDPTGNSGARIACGVITKSDGPRR
ncbi:MAG TPA: superoxide dismutase family protein [Candidatus Limnocylindria bacterium]|nr:superoxide dismutase family protein [Candidatus Limnocylindria bacterium]